MKKNRVFSLTLAILLIVPLVCLTACDLNLNPNAKSNDTPQLQSAQFVAKVTEVKEGQLFVTVIDKGTSSLENGTPAYVSTTFEGYVAPAVGDCIIVKYDTMVQEIYPPIVPNVFSITKCDVNGNPLK